MSGFPNKLDAVEEVQRLRQELKIIKMMWQVDQERASSYHAEVIEERARAVAAESQLQLIDTGCFNCGGLPHSSTCVFRDRRALLNWCEAAVAAMMALNPPEYGAEPRLVGSQVRNAIAGARDLRIAIIRP